MLCKQLWFCPVKRNLYSIQFWAYKVTFLQNLYFGLWRLKKFSLLDCLQLQKSFPSTRLHKYIKPAGYHVAGCFTELYSTCNLEAWCNTTEAIHHSLITWFVQVTDAVLPLGVSLSFNRMGAFRIVSYGYERQIYAKLKNLSHIFPFSLHKEEGYYGFQWIHWPGQQ